MSNEHVAQPFAGILNDLAGEKRHLQNQTVKPRPATNRDRFDALREGWKATCLDGVEAISFGTFQTGVEEFERVLAERSLDRQYDYERSRS
ncbi:MAG: hypothetical protein RJA59_1480 [Pseudomonadota bacterium]